MKSGEVKQAQARSAKDGSLYTVYTKLEYRSEIRLSRQNDLTRNRLGKICPHVNILLFSMDYHCFNDNNKNY